EIMGNVRKDERRKSGDRSYRRKRTLSNRRPRKAEGNQYRDSLRQAIRHADLRNERGASDILSTTARPGPQAAPNGVEPSRKYLRASIPQCSMDHQRWSSRKSAGKIRAARYRSTIAVF